MPTAAEPVPTVADVYLQLLASRGVEVLFGNGGTDFAPIIEAYAKAQAEGRPVPLPIVVPHENVGVAMAHGYYNMTGKLPAMMVHVTLGTANAINGLYNAARAQVPILFTAGRTPLTESGLPGARNNYIHWAQEMFDQGSMLRELVKWDYELRQPVQLEGVVDRAIALAMSEPRGPVYLTLPREVLAMPAAGPAPAPAARIQPAVAPQPDPAALEQLAGLLREARFPLLITANLGRDPAAVGALAALVEDAAIPVVQYRPRQVCLPTGHPMFVGWDAAPLLAEADLILVVEADVPWLPVQAEPAAGAKVVHLGVDPHFSRYPVRGFQADLAITGTPRPALLALHRLLGRLDGAAVASRRERIAGLHDGLARASATMRQRGEGQHPIAPAWAAHCIDAVCDDQTILVNEYPMVLEQTTFRGPQTYFAHSPAGGLGWGLGAALGAKLAAPERTVICTVGDGAYMFGNPTPAHFVSRANGLPVLFIVFNNAIWGAVHRSTLAMYPGGHAARANRPPLSMLDPSPDYEKLVEASGGYGERVTDPAEVPAALQRALHAVRVEGRQALLNVIVQQVFERTS